MHRLGVSPRAVSALQIPAALVLKSYLLLHPLFIGYLEYGANHLTPAPAFAKLALAARGGVDLWRLHYVMEQGRTVR